MDLSGKVKLHDVALPMPEFDRAGSLLLEARHVYRLRTGLSALNLKRYNTTNQLFGAHRPRVGLRSGIGI
jgi:hypothetical protein